MTTKDADFADVWRSVEALRQSVRDGYIKPGRDEKAMLILADRIDKAANNMHDAWVAITDLGSALADVISLLPDPHLDPDKVQAHYVRQAKKVLDKHGEHSMEPNT